MYFLPLVVCGFTTRGFLVVSSVIGDFATVVYQQFKKLYSLHNEGSRCIISIAVCASCGIMSTAPIGVSVPDSETLSSEKSKKFTVSFLSRQHGLIV